MARSRRLPDPHDLAEQVVQALEAGGIECETLIKPDGTPWAVATEAMPRDKTDFTARMALVKSAAVKLGLSWKWQVTFEGDVLVVMLREVK